jgi:hypothetical protein
METQGTPTGRVRRDVAANISVVGEGQLPTGNAHGGWTITRRFFCVVAAAAALAGCGSDGKGGHAGQDPPAPSEAVEPAAPGLDPSIPPPDPHTYATIEDPQEWKNPFLIVGANGVEIVAAGERRPAVAVEALVEALVELPPSAWPYGKVVAARPRAGGEAPVADVETRVEEELEPLGVVVEWWPSE